MKLSAALLLLSVHHATAGKETVDLSGSMENACLNEVYQYTHPNTTLQCLSTKRFWSKISAEANSQCVEGRVLSIKNLVFESSIDWEAYDFSIYVSTSTEFDNSTSVELMNPFLMPLYGEDCAVKSLDGANGVDADGDSCYDVLPFGSGRHMMKQWEASSFNSARVGEHMKKTLIVMLTARVLVVSKVALARLLIWVCRLSSQKMR
jgi:hypothetical protein